MLYWFLKRIMVGPILRAVFRPWIVGAENIPAHGPAILASNHLSFSDSIFLPLMVDRRITFPAKMEYFTAPGLKGRLQAAFFRGTGQIPIDRSGGSASNVALQAGKGILAEGGLFGIYPEGTRSPDGRLYRGKTGVARLTLETGVPVIPIAMIDTDRVQPIGQKMPRVHRVGIIVGKPLDFSRYRSMPIDRSVVRAVTDEVMYELMRLSGQQYVDEYAAVVKKRRASERLRHVAESASARATEASVKAREASARAAEQADRARSEFSGRAKEASVRAAEQAERARGELAERAREARQAFEERKRS